MSSLQDTAYDGRGLASERTTAKAVTETVAVPGRHWLPDYPPRGAIDSWIWRRLHRVSIQLRTVLPISTRKAKGSVGRDIGQLFLIGWMLVQVRRLFVDRLARGFIAFAFRNRGISQSQLFQDLLVLYASGGRQGFFVEIGATDGVSISNSLALEKQGWMGILAEPAACWHDALRRNRSATIDTRCVWSESGRRLKFSEAKTPVLSTLSDYTHHDSFAHMRDASDEYEVETVSLADLLSQHSAPAVIDYLSVDTEGSELAILENFDFARYAFKVITIEHNYCEPDRRLIHDLLSRHGYVRVFKPFSWVDDWYINPHWV